MGLAGFAFRLEFIVELINLVPIFLMSERLPAAEFKMTSLEGKDQEANRNKFQIKNRLGIRQRLMALPFKGRGKRRPAERETGKPRGGKSEACLKPNFYRFNPRHIRTEKKNALIDSQSDSDARVEINQNVYQLIQSEEHFLSLYQFKDIRKLL